LKPVDNFQVRPEVRWDHSDKDAFNGIRDQFTLGVAWRICIDANR